VQVQQQRAAEAEAARQSLLDNHSEMASRCTPDGILLEVNEAYCRTFGRTHDELEGRNYFDLIPPADRIEAVLNLRRLSRRHPESTLDHRIVLPNGEVRWTRWRDSAVFDQDGRVREVLSFGLDVTAEKAMASRVAELQTAFDQMQSLAHTGSLTWDFQSDEMEWTEETARLLGRASEFKTPTLDTLLDLVAPEDRPGLQHCFTLARETGSPFEHEFRVILPDGSFRVLQSRAEVGADPQTKLLNQLTCALRDITVLREAESALRRELRRREAVEQSLAAGHVIHDETGRIISVNRAFCHMTGWSAGELIGRQPPFPYWPAEDADKIAEAFSNTMAGHTPAEGFQFRFRRKDDSRLDVLIRVAPLLDDHDQRLGWLGAITDVTTLQETRRRLHEANERLEVARDIAAFGTWAWNPESGEIIWDRTSFALFGHPDATDAVSVWRAMRPASETARAEQNVLQAEAAGRNAGRFLIHILWPDGSEHSVESSFRRVPRTGTAAVRFIGVHRDITEELARERELRAANERLQIATSVAGFGIWEWNPATDKLTWDRVSFATFGQPEATDANRVWCESLPEEERHRLTAKLQRLIDEGATAGRDLLFITTPTGEQRRVLSTYRLLRDEQGRLQTILGVNSDRTNDPEPDAALTPDFQA
jgi:PAS domain S-box-containing protein